MITKQYTINFNDSAKFYAAFYGCAGLEMMMDYLHGVAISNLCLSGGWGTEFIIGLKQILRIFKFELTNKSIASIYSNRAVINILIEQSVSKYSLI